MKDLRDRIVREVRKVVIGQDHVVEVLLAGTAVGGHVLLEGVPGVAKTLLANTFARAIGVEFRRVQFTPDMLPSDLTGTMTLRAGELAFRPGPVFTNLLLADEINRTPPKTQAALLEAMQEGQVSVDGIARPLPRPFLVVATQNPIEYEGTYPLPEAQLDRFIAKLDVGYPTVAEEGAMLRLAHHGVAPATLADVQTVTTAAELLGMPRPRRRDHRRRSDHRVRRRDRPAHARAAERRAGCQPARRGAPARGREGRGAPHGSRLRDPRRRRRRRTRRPAAPHHAAARGRARALPRRRRGRRRDLVRARAPMTPTPRAAYALLAVALVALAVPAVVSISLVAIVVIATVADVAFAHHRLKVRRTVPRTLSRGVAIPLFVETDSATPGRVEIRQAQPADVEIDPPVGRGVLDAQLVAHRRGAAVLPPVTARCRGPLGLGRCTFTGEGEAPLLVYPDVVAAQRVVVALRRGQFRDPGLRARGPLGLGTDFESIRDYLPDDDVRQINWMASDRVGRPMSNVYRIEQDRDVVCLLDAGRLMTAPLDARTTRLDAAVDAVTMVALVADELGDRCGVTVFDSALRTQMRPRRNGGRAVVRAILDAEPTLLDSDYDLAFRTTSGGKRSLMLVLTDLVDESAARSLVAAVPVLTRRHAVIVASVRDPDLDAAIHTAPTTPHDVYASAVAIDVLDTRRRVVNRLQHAGAQVVEAPAAGLGRSVRARLPAPQSAGAAVAGGRSGAPRHHTSPQNSAPRPKPTINTTVRPLPAGVRKPSTRPATTSQNAVPRIISTAARASVRNASIRVRVPGSTIAAATRSPAAPATTMQLSSSTPCATTSSKNGRPLPAPIASPATAPRSNPFWISR